MATAGRYGQELIVTLVLLAFALCFGLGYGLAKYTESNKSCSEVLPPITAFQFCYTHEGECTLTHDQFKELEKAKVRFPECFK